MRKLDSSCMKSIKGGTIVIEDVIMGSCFEESTLIKTQDGLKMIKDLDLAKDQIWNPVSGQWMRMSRRTASIVEGTAYKIATASGEVTVTGNHPFALLNGQVVQASELKQGDLLAGGEVVRNTSTFAIDGYMIVHNLVFTSKSTNWEDHMVEANGVVSGALYLQDSIEHRTAVEMPALAFN